MVHLSGMSTNADTIKLQRAEQIAAWISALGERAGVNGATYYGEQIECEPRVVRKLAAMGKLPADWWERSEALGKHYGLPPSREWFFKRRARTKPLQREAGPVDVRPEAGLGA